MRVTICNYENILSSALKRAIRLGEAVAAPRVSDLGAIAASTGGKIEMESLGDATEEKVIVASSCSARCSTCSTGSFACGELDEVVGAFQDGLKIEVVRLHARRSSTSGSSARCAPLQAAVRKLGAQRPGRAWPPRSSSCWRACT